MSCLYQIIQPHGLERPGVQRVWMEPGVPVQVSGRAIMTVFFDRGHGGRSYTVRMRIMTQHQTITRVWDHGEEAPINRILAAMTAWIRAVKVTHGKPAALLVEVAPYPSMTRSSDAPHPGSGLAS